MLETTRESGDAGAMVRKEVVERENQRVLFAVTLAFQEARAVTATAGEAFDAGDEIAQFGDDMACYLDEGALAECLSSGGALFVWEGRLANAGWWMEDEGVRRPMMVWDGEIRPAGAEDLTHAPDDGLSRLFGAGR